MTSSRSPEPAWPAFESSFTAALPADPDPANQCRQVFEAGYSRVTPTPVAAPRTLAWWPEVADLLGLDPALCDSDAFAEVMAGNRVLPGMDPHAMCYGGHQFGNWAGQLGDGRAINLGELPGRDGQRWMLQLKGAGATPYSRSADGRAVLRSSIREFLCSEAMHHLGVPTTRALSLVGTGESVVRDMFYDGRPAAEPGAVVCRVAPSFLRFGNFELPAAREDHDLLRRLLDHASGAGDGDAVERYLHWYAQVCARTVEMIVHWMRVGFVHGVMNTDNMSVLGLTIDYGPYGWVDDFDPDWTPNTTDAGGRRYRFGHQPRVALWNLAMLANAIAPVTPDIDGLRAALDDCAQNMNASLHAMQLAKLGLAPQAGRQEQEAALIDQTFGVLTGAETDMTLFYQRLAELDPATCDAPLTALAPALYRPDDASPTHAAALHDWLQAYAAQLREQSVDDRQRQARMAAANPRYVLRNYLAQQAIDAATEGDLQPLHDLMAMLRTPYTKHPELERFAALRPDWARSAPGCSMLSCSS